MSRTPETEKHWPTETPEQLIERIRKEHGDGVAAIVARELVAVPKRKKAPKRRVGNKEKHRPAIPAPKPLGLSAEERRERWTGRWNASNDRNKGRRGFTKSGLPISGAPNPPKKRGDA